MRIERAVIGQRVKAQRFDAPVFIGGELTNTMIIARKRGGRQIIDAVFDPLDRSTKHDRRHDRDDISGVDAHLVAKTTTNVLITGENGTGKGIVAQLLHNVSKRASRQLVTVNIGGLTESIFESELFGHTKGAFTDAKNDRIGRFEMAAGGTLFLDEVGNLALAQQARLLQVVETGEFERVGASRTQQADVRILSATNADLEAEVADGGFRKDLLYRLRTVEIPIPPLRRRSEDIEPLARHFLARYAKKYGKGMSGLDSPAITAMHAHSWPGNVRELDHAIERGVLMARADRIGADDLGLTQSSTPEANLEHLKLAEAESQLIQNALDRHQGNVSLAAADLGLSRSALYRRLEKHGLG